MSGCKMQTKEKIEEKKGKNNNKKIKSINWFCTILQTYFIYLTYIYKNEIIYKFTNILLI